MSVQDLMDVLADADDGAPDPDVVVRRRAWLHAVIGGAALLLAAGYSWRAYGGSGASSWLLPALLGVIALVHIGLLVDARRPLLVADGTGVRIRNGRSWHGLPWSGIARVSLTPRRALWREGRITVTPSDDSAVPLAVPLGLTTVSSTDDLRTALDQLAQRGTVTVSEATTTVPDPEGTPQPDSTPQREPDGAPAAEPDDAPAAEPDETPEPAVDPGPTAHKPRRPAFAVLRAIRPALRSEVTKAGPAIRTATVGTLALAEPLEHASALPEAAELRRSGPGNVSMLVPGPHADDEPPAESSADDAPAEQVELPAQQPVVGSQLVEVRHRLGMTIDDLALRTRIRPHVIEAIEVDDFEPCGGDFYARGHVRALARVLGVEAEPLIRTYDERYATAPVNPRTVFEAELGASRRGRIQIAGGGPHWGALIAVVLVLMLVWGVARLITGG